MNKPGSPAGSNPPAAVPEPTSLSGWFAANGTSLVFTVIALVLIIVYLNVLDVIKVAIGLGLVVFIHELGHFAAAKWCDVHVKTFSIGFGPAIPGCRFQYGETTYMVALIPLGGYVQMVGQEDGKTESEEADDDTDDDPRSYRNKTVGQRMLIISAGVIMNIVLACICFLIVYPHGVKERPAVIGRVDTSSAAWESGIHTGVTIRKINGHERPWFADVQSTVMATWAGEQVRLEIDSRDNPNPREILVEPKVGPDALYPMLGITPSSSTQLEKSARPGFKPYRPGSPAAKMESPFLPGDRVIGMTDPTDPSKVTPLPTSETNDRIEMRPDYAEMLRRMVLLRDRPIQFEVVTASSSGDAAKGETRRVTVAPAATLSLGMRMQMGEITGLVADSPAVKAGVQARKADAATQTTTAGDRIVEVAVTDADGSVLRYAATPSVPPQPGKEFPLDPIRLPDQLERWAERQTQNREVKLTVLRQVGHKDERVTLTATWDDARKYDRTMVSMSNSPVPLYGLGLGYQVKAIVDAVEPGSPAEKAGVQKSDVIVGIQPQTLDEAGNAKPTRWTDVKESEWGYVFAQLQLLEVPTMQIRVSRGDQTPIELTITGEYDSTWNQVDRGMYFRDDVQIQQAHTFGEALSMGVARTLRSIRMIYTNLSAMIFGRVSTRTMSGPITIATVSYSIAGEDIWQFVLFIGLISVNLAVINFLPIPVLDGGHMVFLLYEKIRGKPAPESLQNIAVWIGLAMILSLMAFVMFLDIRRLL
ncbi:peptidase m50 : Peptidase M50 OS=Planctomyces brasiliensis (strain ATCC 49424 / DSM 5305 / JCM 21570 / NBRC 103401 / IFAM 1448) GN=Plabr_4470 PE=4 SV=1: Peptidase_M50 [Tuwongella immobilis]|uniref:PDZ domain-containing protein n=1 Tax=Tuwongella immobilis TaxID=692036 RepID=A0A6C2YSA2_9BACT|nr:peptidase m50 : Peptidase M50 OS=Planctomyces brasiliensis (strain ATCC 49424 / DSM 5305 / JCM 21570 / NBRC 103401 / IFAM 1448) GN=Plabr_4470 PE=4 SV=1: Peptidase_M50 [Tuwongella immobilis]VTS06054.1 peptidase m50 : Peptidase M50 OS=Planctomyces brasiliensis (strain ATCC 49424 / DSM 5305 / JCM 21570 / NBRC 103401 / IFAM 1448) GN=Plabr_4470 PE=4 SV=1: Peptidase_M50 [Tuwongella immobilis]